MGYALSKPYVLKIWDVSVQEKIAFQDDYGLCRLASEQSQHYQMMKAVCTEEEAACVIKAKIESVISGFLQAAVKKKKGTPGTGTASGQAAATPASRIAVYANYVTTDANCMFSSLKGTLQICEAIVCAKTVDVLRLEQAVVELQTLEDVVQRGGDAGVLPELLVGAAGQYMVEATDFLQERKGEIANCRLGNDLREESEDLLKRVPGGSAIPEEVMKEYLDEVNVFLNKVKEIRNRTHRKKSDTPFTSTQLKDLSIQANKVEAFITSFVKGYLRCRMTTAFEWSVEAINNDGYVL